ncbi:probable lipoprotein NlpC [Neptunomonas qingdaonensis]|uniref:Probable lipoprotein NlpC n=2 Tax=Neptunomonas qingdaonensis TaxID=1045558 RepID=A0A1I2U2X2_9GAMM|nr:probable lipoprotein NlpC [Neptunomonas qingdaonensis]
MMNIKNVKGKPLLYLRGLGIGIILNTMLVGCASHKPYTHSPDEVAYVPVKNQLQAHYSRWNGTPYKFGGNSQRGIDCSAFVARTYREVFDLYLPRTTKGQANIGEEVSLHAVRPGDLVLFKTGFKNRHVGIYVGNQTFMHASSSKGVTKSRLDNPYWVDKYWKTIRPADLLLN